MPAVSGNHVRIIKLSAYEYALWFIERSTHRTGDMKSGNNKLVNGKARLTFQDETQ